MKTSGSFLVQKHSMSILYFQNEDNATLKKSNPVSHDATQPYKFFILLRLAISIFFKS